ncbi:MAG: hypothetical protein ACON4U_11220 [Myxococcota bacterium]
MSSPQPSSWHWTLLIHFAYLLMAFTVTAPAWIDPTTIIGGGDQPDWTGTAWAYWWTSYSTGHGINPFDGQWNFFPVGQRPLAQYNLLDAILAIPFLKVFGTQLGYNLFAVITVYSSALGMHLLARTAGATLLPALFAGLTFESSSFLLLEVSHGRLSQALLFFWLIGLSGILRIARGQSSWPMAIATGLAIAATALTYWYWGLFLIFAAVPIWLSEFWFWDKKRWTHLAIAAGVTLVICAPYVYALILSYDTLPGVQRELEPFLDYGRLSRDDFGLAMGIRQSHWPLWPLFHTAADPDDKRIAFIPLILALYACFKPVPEKKRWIAILVIGYVLTLGPYLRWTDKEPFAIALPYLWLYDHFPFFSRFWWPQRLELLVWVGVLILGALQLEQWALRFGKGWRALIFGCIAIGFIDAPIRNPYLPAESFPPRAFKARLYANLKGPIITTPVISPNEITRHILWIQSFHQQPILGGLGDHISAHRPKGYDSYIQSRTILRALAEVSNGTFQGVTITPSDVNELLEDGFVWIVVDPAAYSPGLEGKWAETFSAFCGAIWGQPSTQEGLGKSWKISRINESITIDKMTPVETMGPRTEDGRPTPPSP